MPYSLELFPSKYTAYKCGETVRFMPFVKCDSHQIFEGKVSWRIVKVANEELASGEFDLSEVLGCMEVKVDKPCVLQCRAEYVSPKGDRVTCVAGAPVEPGRLRPVTPMPDDFDSFWQGHLARLSKVPLNASAKRVPGTRFEVYDVQADCVAGSSPMRGLLALPEGAGKGGCPALVFFHGAGVRSSRMETLFDFINRGFIVLDVNAHGVENCRPREFYDALAGGDLKDFQLRGLSDGDPDKCYFLNMFLRNRRALDFMKSRPEWDGRNLFVRGSSMGAFQSFAAAYLDPQVSAVSTNIAAGSDILGGGWPSQSVPAERKGELSKVSPYFDNVNFARRIKCPGYIGIGLIDECCRPDGIFSVANSFAGPHEVEFDFDRAHSCAHPQDARELEFLVACLK